MVHCGVWDWCTVGFFAIDLLYVLAMSRVKAKYANLLIMDIYNLLHVLGQIHIWQVINLTAAKLPSLAQIMAWRRSGDKPLSEPIIV